MGSRAPDPPLLSLRGSAPRRPSGALPQRPSALLTTHSSCGAHGTPAAVPSRGLRLWSRARDPVLRGPGQPGAGASLHVPGLLLPVSCAIVPCWKRRAEVDRGWMRRVIGWSTLGSQNSALDMHVELAASMPGVFCVAKLDTVVH